MQEYTIYIKGMVCQRCVSAVREALEQPGYGVTHLELGAAAFLAPAPPDMDRIAEKLEALGFSLLEDKQLQLVKSIRALVETVYSGDFDFPPQFRFSQWAAEKLQRPYDTISEAFSAAEGITLEKYIIGYRVEKIKELLVYTPATVADIAFRLGFSSEAHLSRQFKAQTGLNPSHFIKIRKARTP
ncbi:helix-turn-helix protein [Chitinophaga japonensis]|uniref:Helix-turn-helix protein n=2 Tax=Chitinophaga japonensis TaxID=104662 RepID=A0A562T0C9_CHIJA|nr:helix-turn-helix protein [Chitinophaga japonensis]